MINRYPGDCALCGANVPANGGKLIRQGRVLRPVHLACAEAGNAVIDIKIGDHTYTRNACGRCIDAPCCGCCTI